MKMNERLIVKTDKWLDDLAARYRDGNIRTLTGASFEQYLIDPAHYDFVARMLRNGKGLRLDDQGRLAAVVG